MRKLFYGIAQDVTGSTTLLPLTFTSAREAQDWIDWQRDHRQDRTRYAIVRCQPTQARGAK